MFSPTNKEIHRFLNWTCDQLIPNTSLVGDDLSMTVKKGNYHLYLFIYYLLLFIYFQESGVEDEQE